MSLTKGRCRYFDNYAQFISIPSLKSSRIMCARTQHLYKEKYPTIIDILRYITPGRSAFTEISETEEESVSYE